MGRGSVDMARGGRHTRFSTVSWDRFCVNERRHSECLGFLWGRRLVIEGGDGGVVKVGVDVNVTEKVAQVRLTFCPIFVSDLY